MAKRFPHPLIDDPEDQVVILGPVSLVGNDVGMGAAPAPGNYPTKQIIGPDVDQSGQLHGQQVDRNPLPSSGLLPQQKGRSNSSKSIKPCEDIGQGNPHFYRLSIL